MAPKVGLGNLITEEGTFPLAEVVAHLRSTSGVINPIRSQGFEIVPVKMKTGFSPKTDTKPSKVRVLSREEILFAEMERFADKKPAYVIGLILVLINSGCKFADIGPVDLHDFILETGLVGISLTEVKRVMEKIKQSDLLKCLIANERIGVARAYKLYR